MNFNVVPNALDRITQEFTSSHSGIDIGWRKDESENQVHPLTNGYVVLVTDGRERNVNTKGNDTYGNYVIIEHEPGFRTLYAHLQKGVKVHTGELVTKETVIGIMGESGRTFGRHLHFSVIINSVKINPKPYLASTEYYKTETNEPESGTNEPESGTNEPEIETNEPETGTKYCIVNGRGASSSYGDKPYTKTFVDKKMKIVRTIPSREYPYALTQDLDSTVVTGWFKESQIVKLND